MLSNETVKQQEIEKRSDSFRKPQGTRIGTLQDWREDSVQSGNSGHGHSIRDGR
jgi:hypothetical protein